MTSRRTFLKTTAALAGSFILPKSLLATPAPIFFFIHADSGTSWPIPDPVLWSLENADHPILARAAEGLAKLTASDADRIIRLVLRRCSLNLLEVHPGRVVVHHWGQQGMGDLRPFFKTHGLARPEVQVVVRDRKQETVTTQHGDEFLYGVPIAPDFDLELFMRKWGRRFEQEPDDLQAAPQTGSGFAWAGVPDSYIPWAALKSAWRRSDPGVCLNCSGGTFLTNFGLRPVGMFNRSPNFVRVCGTCRRSFVDESVKDVPAWIVANLDAEVRPDAEMMWGKRLKLVGKV
jgi:hypothetical protein